MTEFTKEELEKEVWKDVPEFEGIYQVSDLGRVKSLKREKLIRGKYPFIVEERILNPGVNRGGYYQVRLCKNAKHKTLKIHTLVIKTFKPEEYQKCIESPRKWVIDHKIEGNKLNNRLSNLQVITFRENTQKSKDKSQTSSQYFGISFHKASQKWVAQITINGKQKHLGLFPTELEAYEAVQKAEEMAKNGDFSFMNPKEYSSQYKGVVFHKTSKKWQAQIKVNGKSKFLGYFPTELEAHEAYQKAEEMAKNNDFSFMNPKEYSSKYKGVTFHKSRNKWQARPTINGKQKHLGSFPTELEAHQAVQKALEELK